MKIASLHIYPIKSTRAVDLDQVMVRRRGFEYDRRFMVVDETGVFMSQRNCSKLAQIWTSIEPEGLTIGHNGEAIACIISDFIQRDDISVWRHTGDAMIAPDGINAALSRWLEQPVRLAYMDNSIKRMANPDWTAHLDTPAPVSFADGYPILVTNTASLAALNTHIVGGGEPPIDMDRFRTNIAVDHNLAWAEDDWKTLRIGGVVLDIVKPCTRCVIPTLDSKTGAPRGPEPTKSLIKLRKSPDPRLKGVLFGVNAVPRTLGTIEIGDPVEVLT